MTAAAEPNPDSVLEEYIAGPCPQFEGDEDHLYLDTEGYLTVATGCMLPDLSSALRLPFRVQGTGAPASRSAVIAEVDRVKRMPFGQQYAAGFYRSKDALVLAAADRLALRRQRAASCLEDLRHLFPGFDQFPRQAQLGLLDMGFNLGAPRLAKEYVHFCTSVRARDWRTAAAQCQRDAIDRAFLTRNVWTRNRFLAASIAGAA